MNQDWEEERIERLFREMRQEDERLAPSFAKVTGVGLATNARRGRPVLRFAVVTALLVLLIGSAVFLVTRVSKRTARDDIAESTPGPSSDQGEGNPSSNDNVGGAIENGPAPAPVIAKRNSIHRSRGRGHTESSLISQWRSPTDFLLSVPGEQLLRTVPRLGERRMMNEKTMND